MTSNIVEIQFQKVLHVIIDNHACKATLSNEYSIAFKVSLDSNYNVYR